MDTEQRQLALGPDQSFIVQAPAGSGKTELLIQRYLRLLACVDEPEEILAMTFTRKAAAEMRGRILAALEDASKNSDTADRHNTKTITLAQQALRCDQEKNWHVLLNPARLRIQTIDSLCAALTRRTPVLTGFGAQPETTDNAEEYYHQAALNALAELETGRVWSAAIETLLTHLDNDLPRVRDMLIAMLARREQWLRYIARGQQKDALQRDRFESALMGVVESVLSELAMSFPEDLAEELLALINYAAANLLDNNPSSPVSACHEMQALPSARATDLKKWRGIAAFCLTDDDSIRKCADVNLGFPPPSSDKIQAERCRSMKRRFAGLTSSLAAHGRLIKNLREVKALPPVHYTDNEWVFIEAVYQLLLLAEAQLRILFAERNKIDFSGVAQAANQALGEADKPTDLALYLEYEIKHILVDEFQDISINQYVLLQKLISGWSPGDGHSLFLVGDPMQSIYRFREAQVALFLNVWREKRLDQFPLTPVNITVNFRSAPGIVHWVNNTFSRVLPEIPDLVRGAVAYVQAQAGRDGPDGEPVNVHPLINAGQAEEAGLVVKLVEQARLSASNASIAILVRNRNHLLDIIPALKRAAIGFRAVDIEALGAQPEIQDLLALTLALNYPADRIAWLAVLRAPWCGLLLEDLHTLAAHPAKAICAGIEDDALLSSLSRDGQRRLGRIRGVLQSALATFGRYEHSHFIKSVWVQLGGPATVKNAARLQDTALFFSLLSQFEQGGVLRDRDRFVEQVLSLYASPEVGAEDDVQIMTIHKAKGLEFDTVIIPGLSRGTAADEAQLLLWLEQAQGDAQKLLLAPIKQAGEDAAPIYQFLKGIEKEKQYFENGRLLYVGATRAKNHLHLIGTVKTRAKGDGVSLAPPHGSSLLRQLWPVVEDEYRQAAEQADMGQSGQIHEQGAGKPLIRRLTDSWSLPAPALSPEWKAPAVSSAPPTNDIEFEWAGATIKHIGTVVHHCIERLASEGLKNAHEIKIRSDRQYYICALKRLGVTGEELAYAGRQVESALINMTGDERGRWILDGEHQEQENEYAITGLHEGRLVSVVIDRTFIDSDGIRWIIDYKTSRHEGADLDMFLDEEQTRYARQLEKYGHLMQGVDERPVKLGLYFPLLCGWREWTLKTRAVS